MSKRICVVSELFPWSKSCLSVAENLPRTQLRGKSFCRSVLAIVIAGIIGMATLFGICAEKKATLREDYGNLLHIPITQFSGFQEPTLCRFAFCNKFQGPLLFEETPSCSHAPIKALFGQRDREQNGPGH